MKSCFAIACAFPDVTLQTKSTQLRAQSIRHNRPKQGETPAQANETRIGNDVTLTRNGRETANGSPKQRICNKTQEFRIKKEHPEK